MAASITVMAGAAHAANGHGGTDRALSASCPTAVYADVVAHPYPQAALADSDPRLAANKRLAFDMWRSIVNAGHVELADTMLAEGYIQHSPILPTGRAAFKQIFSAVPRIDIPASVSPPLVATVAEGDLVVMALRESWPSPDGSGEYTTTHFNLFRVEDGRLAEHWHSVQQAPGPGVKRPDEGGPQRVIGVTGKAREALLHGATERLAQNKRLVFDAWQGRGQFESACIGGMIEHDPTETPKLAPSDAPLVAVVAGDDLVVLVTALEHPHPVRAGDTYTTTWFDMFRVQDGRLTEHWNAALRPGTAMPTYGL